MNFCKMNSPLGELYIFEEDNKIVQKIGRAHV